MILRGQRFLAPLSLALLAGAACGGQELPPPPPPAVTASATPAPPPPAPTPEPPKAEKPQLPDVAFGPVTPSDNPAKMPQVAIKAPAKEAVIPAAKAADFEVKLDVKNWDLQPGGGHVHVILDGHPYVPVYDLKEPLKLSKLIGANDTLAEGEHLIVAFPGRQNHESVKGQTALAITHFWVGKKAPKPQWTPKDPMLIYSRPKGTYNASKADHVLVDWYLVNAELAEGKNSLKATVKGPGVDEGRTVNIKEWKPYALDNLRNGEYSVSLELQDKEGKAVPGAWNSTSRTITINRDAPEDPAPPPPAAAPEKKDDKPKADAAKDKPKADKPAPAGDKPAGDKPASEKK